MARYLQIDNNFFYMPKNSALGDAYGANGYAVYLFILTMMLLAVDDEYCAVEITGILINSISKHCKIKTFEVSEIIAFMKSNDIQLLKTPPDRPNHVYSNGFLKRTGKLLASDAKRKKAQQEYMKNKADNSSLEQKD